MRLKNKWMGGALAALLLLVGCRPVETTEITFGGDIILARDGQALFMDNPWGAFAAAEAPVSDANSLFFANLESPLGLNNPSDEAGPYNLCADAGLAEQLRAGGLSLVNTVNNHAEDCALANASTEELAVEGRLSTREYDDRDGNRRSVTEMTVDRVHFCGKNEDAQGTFPRTDVKSQLVELDEDDSDLPF